MVTPRGPHAEAAAGADVEGGAGGSRMPPFPELDEAFQLSHAEAAAGVGAAVAAAGCANANWTFSIPELSKAGVGVGAGVGAGAGAGTWLNWRSWAT
jgi:hypothetical protein